VSEFSEDGLHWWDGTTWVLTAEVLIPPLAPSRFERPGEAARQQQRMSRLDAVGWMTILFGATIVGLPIAVFFLLYLHRTYKSYRAWRLDTLAEATAYLLGPDEPMLAGETALRQSLLGVGTESNLAVAVTAGHVLLFDTPRYWSPPLRVALAARPEEVELYSVQPSIGRPLLRVVCRGRQWGIGGSVWIFQPQPVVEAWWKVRQERATAARSA
jgi:hypothetical protein